MTDRADAVAFHSINVCLLRCQHIADRRARGLPAVQPGSSLALDDALLHPFELSHAVAEALGSSLDHLTTLRVLISDAEVVPMAAPFTLMRAAVENAAVAVWLLESAEPVERRRRTLLLNLDDGHDQANALLLAGHPAGSTSEAERSAMIFDAAARAGVDPASISGRRPGWRQKIQTAGEAVWVSGTRLEFVWSFLSGYTHGRRWAHTLMGEMEPVSDPKTGSDLYKITASFSGLALAVEAATAMVEGAEKLEERARLHWR